MVELTRAQANRVPQIATHAGDVTAWEQGEYDVVQCALGVFFFPDMTMGTEHLISLARTHGRVALTIWQEGAIEALTPHLRAAREQVTGEEGSERPRSLID